MLKTIYECGYSSSDLISHVFSKAPLFYNIPPKEILNFKNEKVLKTFYAIGQMNVLLCNEEKKILIANINFEKNFRKAIENPTPKTKQASDNYWDWFKMCNNLKFLFYFDEKKGKELFHLFSSLSEKYSEKEVEKFWKNCNPTYGFIPAIFSIIGKCVDLEAKLPDRKEVVKKSFFKKVII